MTTVVIGEQQAGIETVATINVGMMPSAPRLRRHKRLTSTSAAERSKAEHQWRMGGASSRDGSPNL
eukprot:3000449-Amphidinium_carterae.1